MISAIDQVIGCQQCGMPLEESPSGPSLLRVPASGRPGRRRRSWNPSLEGRADCRLPAHDLRVRPHRGCTR